MRRFFNKISKHTLSDSYKFRLKSTQAISTHDIGSSKFDSEENTSLDFVDDPNWHVTVEGKMPVTTKLSLDKSHDPDTKWPVYRVLDTQGVPIKGAVVPKITEEEAQEMYTTMVKSQTLDDIFYNAQRQGRISFYMQHSGEEALTIGSASALSHDDVVLAQYREAPVLLWRGFTIQQCADQCYGNSADIGKGKQMPIHYGSAKLNFQTISSPLCTQVPQAVGVAYALKHEGKDAIACVYFGEGAASEGDFHAGMNFAATLDAPVLFFCRNNGYAISTPVRDQYRGDGIIHRVTGYGMKGIRVDGNDLLAVRAATELARETAIKENCPVMIEAMTYRRGHHSTSDDSTRYRALAEIEMWREKYDPVERFRKYMLANGWWNEDKEVDLRDRLRVQVVESLEIAEGKPLAELECLFEDVYATKHKDLLKQEEELRSHIAKFPDHYNISNH